MSPGFWFVVWLIVSVAAAQVGPPTIGPHKKREIVTKRAVFKPVRTSTGRLRLYLEDGTNVSFYLVPGKNASATVKVKARIDGEEQSYVSQDTEGKR